VAFSGSQDGSTNPTVTISGGGFLPEPAASPGTCGGSLFPGTQLHFGVKSTGGGGFNAGAAGNLLGLAVASYSDTNIAYQFGTGGCGYPTFGKVAQGDTFTVDVNGASCTGTVDYIKRVQCAGPLLDTTPPTLSLPSDLVVDAVSPSGASVSFTASSSDDDGLPYPVSCTPASGSMFLVGTTTVGCHATDAAGNTASGSFHVTVRSAVDQLTKLIADLRGLPPGRSLTAKLQNVLARLQAGDTRAACNLLAAFASEVRAQSGKSLSTFQADGLAASAVRIEGVLGC
jgi:HYR domain